MASIRTESLTAVHWVAMALAAVSGVVHLVIGLGGLPSPLAISFVLAGLGFFGAVALVLVDWRRRLLYAAGIPFTGIQIVLWYGLNGPPIDATEAVDKLAQVGLILLLALLLAREQ